MKSIANIIHHKLFPLGIFDDKGQLRYYEKSDGDWWKYEFDDNGQLKYYENSFGEITEI